MKNTTNNEPDDNNQNRSKVHPNNKLNELTSTEWIPETISVWRQQGLGKNHPDTKIEKEHPAPFSFTDIRRLVRFFTKSGETVLDPFCGIGSTLKACVIENRKGIGIELNPRYAKLSEERLENEVGGLFPKEQQTVLVGDARDLLNTIDNNSIDFIVTSPPYWNILHKVDHKAKQERIENGLDTKYSKDKRDFGNIEEYNDFLSDLSALFGQCADKLKPKKYMAIIVSDFRDKSNYVMFHSDLVNSLSSYNIEIRGITILYQSKKRVFPYGYPYAYVPNIHHQYILIFQKAGKTK